MPVRCLLKQSVFSSRAEGHALPRAHLGCCVAGVCTVPTLSPVLVPSSPFPLLAGEFPPLEPATPSPAYHPGPPTSSRPLISSKAASWGFTQPPETQVERASSPGKLFCPLPCFEALKHCKIPSTRQLALCLPHLIIRFKKKKRLKHFFK